MLNTATHSSTHTRGRRGEDIAVEYLLAHGYKIIQRNYRDSCPEVDIIAGVGNTLCFCEVKAWQNVPAVDLLRSIGRIKRQRIVTAARHYVHTHPLEAGTEVRFDVLFVDDSGACEHFAAAFDASR